MKERFIFFIIIFFSGITSSYSQEKFNEVLVSELKGEDKCLYEIFLKNIKANIVFPDSTNFYSKIRINKTGNIFKIQSFAKAKSEIQINVVSDIIMDYELHLERLGKSIECNPKEWKITKLKFEQAYAKPVDTDFYIKTPNQYDKVVYSHKDYALVKKNKKWGAVSKNNKLILAIKYDSLVSHPFGLKAKIENGWAFINALNGNHLSKRIYSKIEDKVLKVNNREYVVAKMGKSGILSKDMVEVTPFIYDDFLIPLGNRYLIGKRDGKQALISELNGKELTTPKYDFITSNYTLKEILLVGLNNKIGVIDSVGNEILPVSYDKIFQPINASILGIKQNQKFALYDFKIRKQLSGFIYDEIFNVKDLIGVELQNKRGVVDKTGKIIIPIAFDRITYVEGLGSGSNKLKIYCLRLNEQVVYDEKGNCLSNCK